MYAVMKAFSWKSVVVAGNPVVADPEGPQHFIPVFDNYSQAVKFQNGKTDNIAELETAEENRP